MASPVDFTTQVTTLRALVKETVELFVRKAPSKGHAQLEVECDGRYLLRYGRVDSHYGVWIQSPTDRSFSPVRLECANDVMLITAAPLLDALFKQVLLNNQGDLRAAEAATAQVLAFRMKIEAE